MAKIGRNDPCSCGSGKKYKKCCQPRHVADVSHRARIAHGYDCMMQGRAEDACDCWWEVWTALRLRLRPEMTETDDAQAVYPDAANPNSHIHDWAQDLAQELGNAARRQVFGMTARQSPSYAKRGVQLCSEIVDQFPAEHANFLQCFRADLGEFLFLDGRDEEGEREMNDLIRDYPDVGMGYARYATVLHSRYDCDRDVENLRRAVDLMQRALDQPVVDPQHYDIEHRLVEMRGELEAAESSATERATGTGDS